MAPDAWDQYLRWNDTICDLVFPQEMAGSPVYLDMDDSVLSRLGKRLSIPSADVEAELAQSVRATLSLDGGPADIFLRHTVRLKAWRQLVARDQRRTGKVPPPPVIGLLAVFTLAAEAMGKDLAFAVHAYYPRLAAILGVDEPGRERLQTAYQASAETLWQGLNDWLTVNDGRFGVPTAHAFSKHRYISLPMSQALVRAADRRQLVQMFHHYALPAGSNVPPSDMAAMLDGWVQQTSSPASKNLQRLWKMPGARDRIAEIAANELHNWNDHADTAQRETRVRRHDLRLTAQIRRVGRSRLQLSFVASLPASNPPDLLTIESAPGSPSLAMLPLASGAVFPASATDIDSKSLLEGTLLVTDERDGASAVRMPRRVIAMCRDELTNAFVEQERVQLGEDSILLVKQHDGLPERVAQVLAEIARPGFATTSEMKGLPAGWTLFADLQILGASKFVTDNDVDLQPLIPLISSQLTISGGLKIPGNLRKWSALAPPEVRAVSQVAHSLVLCLSQTHLAPDQAQDPLEWAGEEGALFVDLAEHELSDGDYELTLKVDGKLAQRAILRLCSSDTPDQWTWESRPRLSYQPGSPLTATRTDTEGTGQVVYGAAAPTEGVAPVDPAPSMPAWVFWPARPPFTSGPKPIVIDEPAPDSCVVTGKHKMLIDSAYGLSKYATVGGTCEKCQLVKRYPTFNGRLRQSGDLGALRVAEPARMAGLPAVRPRSANRDHALDALIHTGGGGGPAFVRIASQIDNSAMAVDALRNDLESLAHIEVERDDRNTMTSWSVTPPQLVKVSDGSFFLAGAWGETDLEHLETAVCDLGGKISHANEAGPRSLFVEELDIDQVRGVATLLGELYPSRVPLQVVPNAASALVNVLPALSSVGTRLHRIPLPGARMIERFDTTAAAWLPVATAGSAGAYRMLSGHRRVYGFRSQEDVDRGKLAIGSPSVVKHLAAMRRGKPFLAYYPEKHHLAVPLGAPLPGLYGRAAVLNSGQLPIEDLRAKALVYREVPEDFAARLFTLFSS